MILILFHVFASFGLAYIVGHAKITVRLRELLFGDKSDIGPVRWFRETFVELLECPACFGFWTGVVASLANFVPGSSPITVIGWGLFTAGTNYTLAKITRLID